MKKNYKDLSHLVERYLKSNKVKPLKENTIEKKSYPSTFDKKSKAIQRIDEYFADILFDTVLLAKIIKLDEMLKAELNSIDNLDDILFENNVECN